jgi:hypothetical protein
MLLEHSKVTVPFKGVLQLCHHNRDAVLVQSVDIALRLFDLVNAITEQMVSHPKTVGEMYAKLPEGKRKAIEARDQK